MRSEGKGMFSMDSSRLDDDVMDDRLDDAVDDRLEGDRLEDAVDDMLEMV